MCMINIWVNFFFINWQIVQVKSVLDPCEDENDDNEENEISLGADSEQRHGFSETDSEVKWS